MADSRHIAPALHLSGFLRFLSQRGFLITPQTHEWVQEVVDALLPQYFPGPDRARQDLIQDLRTLICPVVAHSEEEQAQFYAAFDQYFRQTALGRQRIAREDEPPPPLPYLDKLDENKKAPPFSIQRLVNFIFIVAIAATLLYILGDHLVPYLKNIPWLSYFFTHFDWILIACAIAGIGVVTLIRIRPLLERWSARLKGTEPLGPPYKFFPYTEPPPMNLIQVSDSLELVDTFSKRRETDLNTHAIDIPKTIDATVQGAGRIEVQYEKDLTQVTQYLVLLDEATLGKHHMPWFTYLVEILQANGVRAEQYFFHSDPRYCRDSRGITYQWDQLFDGNRLLVVGTGESLIDPLSGEIYPWAFQGLDLWEKRGLLTVKPPTQWGFYESILSRYIELAPTTMDGLFSIIEEFDGIGENDPEEWLNKAEDALLAYPTPELLRDYIEPGLFTWICTCAIYPEIYWNLTLQLGFLLEEKAHDLLNRRNLTLLTKIKWFKEGEIPDADRKKLLGYLPDGPHRKVRTYLDDLLAKNRFTFPGVETVAGHTLRLFQLTNRLYLHGDDPAGTDEIRALKRRGEVEDDEILKADVDQALKAPAALTLPEEAGEIAATGTPNGAEAPVHEGLTLLANLFEVPIGEFQTPQHTTGRLFRAILHDPSSRQAVRIYARKLEANPLATRFILDDDLWNMPLFSSYNLISALNQIDGAAARVMGLCSVDDLIRKRLQLGVYYLLNPGKVADRIQFLGGAHIYLTGGFLFDVLVGLNSTYLNKLLIRPKRSLTEEDFALKKAPSGIEDGFWKPELEQVFAWLSQQYIEYFSALQRRLPALNILVHGYADTFLWERVGVFEHPMQAYMVSFWRRTMKRLGYADEAAQRRVNQALAQRYRALMQEVSDALPFVQFINLQESGYAYSHQNFGATYSPNEGFLVPAVDRIISFARDHFKQLDPSALIKTLKDLLKEDPPPVQHILRGIEIAFKTFEVAPERLVETYLSIRSRHNSTVRSEAVERDLLNLIHEIDAYIQSGDTTTTTSGFEFDYGELPDDLEGYYERLLREFPEAVQQDIERLVREDLIFWWEGGNSSRKVDETAIFTSYTQLHEEVMETLVLKKMLKTELGDAGRLEYELLNNDWVDMFARRIQGAEPEVYQQQQTTPERAETVETEDTPSRQRRNRQLGELRSLLAGNQIESALQLMGNMASGPSRRETAQRLADLTNQYLDNEDRQVKGTLSRERYIATLSQVIYELAGIFVRWEGEFTLAELYGPVEPDPSRYLSDLLPQVKYAITEARHPEVFRVMNRMLRVPSELREQLTQVSLTQHIAWQQAEADLNGGLIPFETYWAEVNQAVKGLLDILRKWEENQSLRAFPRPTDLPDIQQALGESLDLVSQGNLASALETYRQLMDALVWESNEVSDPDFFEYEALLYQFQWAHLFQHEKAAGSDLRVYQNQIREALLRSLQNLQNELFPIQSGEDAYPYYDPNDPQPFIDHIKKLIAQAALDEAFTLLNDNLGADTLREQYADFSLLVGRWRELSRNQIQGLLTQEQFEVRRNQIVVDLLAFLEEWEDRRGFAS